VGDVGQAGVGQRIFGAQIRCEDPDFLGVELLIRKNQLSAEPPYEFRALSPQPLGGFRSAQLRERLTDLRRSSGGGAELMGQTEREPGQARSSR
jgi:hypothetical protein